MEVFRIGVEEGQEREENLEKVGLGGELGEGRVLIDQ